MKVKIIKSTVAKGQDLFAGKIYDLDEKTAKLLILMGKAKEVKVKNGNKK